MLAKWVTILDALHLRKGSNIASLLAQLSCPDARGRWKAAEALAPYATAKRVAEALIDALGDSHPFVRWQAGKSLAQCRNEHTLALLETALSTRNTHRRSVVDALGRLGDNRAADALCKALESRSAEVRCSAAEALAHLADPTILPKLRQALKDSDAHVRRAVVTALGAIGCPQVVPELLPMLEDDSALVRASVAKALGRIADPRAADPLRNALGDSDPGVRWQAADALGTVADPEALPLLIPLLVDKTEVFGVSIAEAARCSIESIEQRKRNSTQSLANACQESVSDHSE